MFSAILKLPYLDAGFYIVVYGIITFLGITIGSFLNVCIYRIPKTNPLLNEPLIARTATPKFVDLI